MAVPEMRSGPVGDGTAISEQPKSNAPSSSTAPLSPQPLARQRITREEAEVILDEIESAAIDAAISESIRQGVDANFIVEGLDRAQLWAWSNLAHRLHGRKPKAP